MLLGAGIAAIASDGVPTWIQVAAFVFSIVGIVGTVVGIIVTVRRSPRRTNESAIAFGTLASIRRWHPTQFSLALGQLRKFRQRLERHEFADGRVRGEVTEGDLYRWLIQQAITCAACIVPQSLGKANLFRVSQLTHDDDGRRVSVSVYSSEFVGVFTPDELIDELDPNHIRSLRYIQSQSDAYAVPTALQCSLRGTPVLHAIHRLSHLDRPEAELGATHILGIPLAERATSISFLDQPVSITVELRYGRFRSILIRRRISRGHRARIPVVRRAKELIQELAQVELFREERMNKVSQVHRVQTSPSDQPRVLAIGRVPLTELSLRLELGPGRVQ